MSNYTATSNSIQQHLETVLAKYATVSNSEPFGSQSSLWTVFRELKEIFQGSKPLKKYPSVVVKWSMGQGNWAKVPWIAFLDERETRTTQDGIYGILLFRQDMSGVYLTFNQGVTKPKEEFGTQARRKLRAKAEELHDTCEALRKRNFLLDDKIDLRAKRSLGVDYEYSTIAYKLYQTDQVPDDNTLLQDLEAILQVYNQYIESKLNLQTTKPPIDMTNYDLANAFNGLTRFIRNQGFTFEPWQIAAYVTALRTKPFVILAGISGTGKSKLPALVAQGTGGHPHLISVRPDWTDSAEVLGYVNLQDEFQPGVLLQLAREASQPENQAQHYVAIIDEMNLARVEHYFAEVLSQIENRKPSPNGGFDSGALVVQQLTGTEGEQWASVGLPSNLAIVGTVNIDESTHGLSRKVLDRAFTLEFSDINLTNWEVSPNTDTAEPTSWPVSAWYPRAIRLSQVMNIPASDHNLIDETITTLTQINNFLKPAQLQVGYRTRDEIVLFVLHARDLERVFKTSNGDLVDPLDLALQMKILPRIVGGSNAIRQVILNLLGWAVNDKPINDEQEVETLIDTWIKAGRPLAIEANYPRTAARLCLMWERLYNEGFTSFWL